MTTRNRIAFAAGFVAVAAALVRLARRSRRLDFAGRSVVITTGSRVSFWSWPVSSRGRAPGSRLLPRDRKELEVARLELEASGADVSAVVCDIGVPSEATDLIHQVIKRTGRIDILINNAGIMTVGVPRGAILVNRFLLPAPERNMGTESYSGWQSMPEAVPSVLTKLTGAALQNNEIPVSSRPTP